jgi:hypothetical protein
VIEAVVPPVEVQVRVVLAPAQTGDAPEKELMVGGWLTATVACNVTGEQLPGPDEVSV